MANEIKKIEVVGKVGEVSTSPKAMQASKPDPEPIQGARKTLSPQEQSELNKALLALMEKHLWAYKLAGEGREELISLINAGAKLESKGGSNAETLIKALLILELEQNKSLFPEEILQTAQFFVSYNSSFGPWSHDVCHLFEGYYRKDSSLLDHEENRATVELLLNEMARRAASDRERGCVSRILGPLASYNLDNAKPADSGVFAFKPQSLQELLSLGFLDERDLAFCESESPRELMERLTSIAKNGQVEYSTRGLFVDVDGTLINSDGSLNQKVIDEMNKAKASGMEITIFTGGSPRVLSEKLEELGLENKLEGARWIQVRSKAEYIGEKLERLIDDTPPEIQGFAAEKWVTPGEL